MAVQKYERVAREKREEKGTDGDCRITEKINTFTIHQGIFTSDNLLAKLGKLVGTPLLSSRDSLILRSPFFFCRFMHPEGYVEFRINVCAISRGNFVKIHKLTFDYPLINSRYSSQRNNLR